MSRLMPGNFTAFRASHTVDSRSFAMSLNPSLAVFRIVPPRQGGDPGADLLRQLLLAAQPVLGGIEGRAVGDDHRAGPDDPALGVLDRPSPLDAHRDDRQTAL